MGCCNANKKSLIGTTINPIWHSHPVHHGTKFYVLIILKCKETLIRRVWLVQQSIPFAVAILYIMVQNFMFSLALNARKTSSLHTILF